jgi:hypothetical protein
VICGRHRSDSAVNEGQQLCRRGGEAVLCCALSLALSLSLYPSLSLSLSLSLSRRCCSKHRSIEEGRRRKRLRDPLSGSALAPPAIASAVSTPFRPDEDGGELDLLMSEATTPDIMNTSESMAFHPPHRRPHAHHLPTFIEVAEMEATGTDMLSNDELSSAEQAWALQQDHDSQSPHGSPVLSPADSADTSKASAPIQKRRRVTRACDGMPLHSSPALR